MVVQDLEWFLSDAWLFENLTLLLPSREREREMASYFVSVGKVIVRIVVSNADERCRHAHYVGVGILVFFSDLF